MSDYAFDENVTAAVLDLDTKRSAQLFSCLHEYLRLPRIVRIFIPASLIVDARGRQMHEISRREQELILAAYPAISPWTVPADPYFALPRQRSVRRLVHIGAGAAPDTLISWLSPKSLINVMSAVAVDVRAAAARRAKALTALAFKKPVAGIACSGSDFDYTGTDVTIVSLLTAGKVDSLARWVSTTEPGALLLLRTRGQVDAEVLRYLDDQIEGSRCEWLTDVRHVYPDLRFESLLIRRI